MDFRLSDEQRMLDESAARFFETEFPFKTYRDALTSRQVFDPSRWQKMTDLGWLACAFPESVGGYGGTLVDAQLIARRMGERLALDPWLSLVVVPGKLLEFLGNSASMALLTAIVCGDSRVALACYEAASHHDPLLVETRLTARQGEWVLNGRKSIVEAGASVDYLLVTARDDSGNFDDRFLCFSALPKNYDHRKICQVFVDRSYVDHYLDYLCRNYTFQSQFSF